MEQLRAKKGFIIDMDGVIYHGNRLLPGAKEFVEWLYSEEKEFLFLTNSSRYTPKELQKKLEWMGLDVIKTIFIQVRWQPLHLYQRRRRRQPLMRWGNMGFRMLCMMPALQLMRFIRIM